MPVEEKDMVTPHMHLKEMTDNRFLSAEIFEPGVDKILTIKGIQKELLENPMKKSQNTKAVLYFEETDLLLALNKVNTDTIIKLYGTGFADDLVGKKIQLFATTTQAFGDTVKCIRIRNFVPEYKCSVCGKKIEENVYNASVRKYGKPYCGPECLEKHRKGEQIL